MNQEALFFTNYFPKNEMQLSLLEKFKNFRAKFGEPNQVTYLKSLLRTKPYTRTVYPPDWNNQKKFAETTPLERLRVG
jgi:hypothetical protein